MGFSRTILLFMLLLILLIGCSTDRKQRVIQLHVSAASSLNDALKQIEKDFEARYPKIDVIINFASSGILKRQIEQGAPTDVFLSASLEKFQQLDKKNLLDPKHTTHLLENQLVLITHIQHPVPLNTLGDLDNASIRRISIGVPESVPAGRYAKETLLNLDLWEKVKDKIISAKDVRQVLSYVETRNVNIGFVYKTDAMSSSKITVLKVIDSSTHEPIIYPAGILKNTKEPNAAKLFFTYIQNKKALHTFEDAGYSTIK